MSRLYLVAQGEEVDLKQLQELFESSRVKASIELVNSLDELPAIVDFEESKTYSLPYNNNISNSFSISFDRTLKSIEKSVIIHYYARYKDNISGMAKALGIARATLYRKLKEYNITFSSSSGTKDDEKEVA